MPGLRLLGLGGQRFELSQQLSLDLNKKNDPGLTPRRNEARQDRTSLDYFTQARNCYHDP